MRTICPLNIQGYDTEEYICSEEATFENMKNMFKGGIKGAHLTYWWNSEGKWFVTNQLGSLLTKRDEKCIAMEHNNCWAW